jgi:hypothetical protein
VLGSGQSVTYDGIISGGTLPITANLVLVSNSMPIQINGASTVSGTAYNTIVLGAGGNAIFTINVVDSASTNSKNAPNPTKLMAFPYYPPIK